MYALCVPIFIKYPGKEPRTQGHITSHVEKMALASAGHFCNVFSSQTISRANNFFHAISIQQEAICNFDNENLKVLKLTLQIFGLYMVFAEGKQQFKHTCM